jgi:hypothetical protein
MTPSWYAQYKQKKNFSFQLWNISVSQSDSLMEKAIFHIGAKIRKMTKLLQRERNRLRKMHQRKKELNKTD